jgi:hypothetical protein
MWFEVQRVQRGQVFVQCFRFSLLPTYSFIYDLQYFLFVSGDTAHLGPRPPRFEVSISHTVRHTHTHSRTALNEWSVRRRGRYLHNTQQTNNIHRTRDPRNQSTSDVRLIPHGQRDWFLWCLILPVYWVFTFCSLAQQPNAGQGRLMLEVCRSHTITHHSR